MDTSRTRLCLYNGTDRNIILFILSAHTSHILQPPDVGCYKSMQYMFNSECHKFTRESKCVVTRFIVCQIVCKVYSKVMSADNLISSFRKEINWHLPTWQRYHTGVTTKSDPRKILTRGQISTEKTDPGQYCMTYVSRWQQASQTVSPKFFSLFLHCTPPGVPWPFIFLQELKSEQFWYLSCCCCLFI